MNNIVYEKGKKKGQPKELRDINKADKWKIIGDGFAKIRNEFKSKPRRELFESIVIGVIGTSNKQVQKQFNANTQQPKKNEPRKETP
jgi:hypothetical protein